MLNWEIKLKSTYSLTQKQQPPGMNSWKFRGDECESDVLKNIVVERFWVDAGSQLKHTLAEGKKVKY